MSQKSGKMLKRYALHKKMKLPELKELKRWWAALPWNERAKVRTHIEMALQTKAT